MVNLFGLILKVLFCLFQPNTFHCQIFGAWLDKATTGHYSDLIRSVDYSKCSGTTHLNMSCSIRQSPKDLQESRDKREESKRDGGQVSNTAVCSVFFLWFKMEPEPRRKTIVVSTHTLLTTKWFDFPQIFPGSCSRLVSFSPTNGQQKLCWRKTAAAEDVTFYISPLPLLCR